MEENKKIKSFKKGKVKNSEIELEVEITPETLAEHKMHVLAHWKKDFSMPGFRKGNVPEHIILENVNPGVLLEEAAEHALQELYPEIVEMAEIDPVTPPQIRITKLAEGNPLEVKILVGVQPEIKLPNYKKIAKKIWDEKEKATTDEKELEEVVNQLRRMRYTPKAGEKEENLPELTDEDVKQFGNFANVAEFKEKLKENLLSEKEFDINKRARDKMIRDIVEESKLEIPPLLAAMEFEEFRNQFEQSLKEGGETIDQYLERSKKTAEEVGKDQREYIERSLKTKFVLSEILKVENIHADPAEAEKEAVRIKNYRPDMNEKDARAYAESMILNEKLFALLEGREEKKEEPKDKTAE